MFKTELDDFFDFFDLLVQSTYHIVGAIGDFLHHHQGNKRIDGGGEHFLQLVGVGQEGHAFAHGELGDIDCVRDVDDWKMKAH